jgi:hypothetical protein
MTAPKHLTPADRKLVEALDPDSRYQYEERVAIAFFDGGVPEWKAEEIAFRELVRCGVIQLATVM